MMNTIVNEVISLDDISLGMIARIQRVLQRLSLQDVASLACACEKNVELFESNRLLPCAAKLKLLNAYNTIIEANMTRVSSQ